jgi:peptidoglycan/xylan/chitin deacetylase (PgdA/CDA1 family)
MWPADKRAAVAFTFDFDAEEVWIGMDAANATRPGVLSQGAYGAKVGLPLVLELLARHELTATFFVPGRVAERYPERVAEILTAGHEIGLHGYTHRGPGRLAGVAEEVSELDRSLAVLRALGANPVGFRSPSWDFGEQTLALLAERGIVYSSNMMDDIRPYVHQPSGIVELPVQWILDDAPHFMFDNASWEKTIRSPREVGEIWEAELRGIHALGGLGVLTTHPQFIGRPGRLPLLERTIELVLALEGVWVATAGEIARHVRARAEARPAPTAQAEAEPAPTAQAEAEPAPGKSAGAEP